MIKSESIFIIHDDKKLIKIGVTSNKKHVFKDADVTVYVHEDLEHEAIKYALLNSCNYNNSYAIKLTMDDLVDIFDNRTKWRYEEFIFFKKDIPKIDFSGYTGNTTLCLSLLNIGKNIDLFDIEDVLEKLNGTSEYPAVIFATYNDGTLNDDEINLGLFCKID